jgi:hypothetical protein
MERYSIMENNPSLSPFAASILSLLFFVVFMVGCGSSSSDSDTKKVGSLSITVENSDDSDDSNDLRVQILDTEDRLIWDEYFESDEENENNEADMDPLPPGDYKVRVFEVKKDEEEYTKRFGTEHVGIVENKESFSVTVELGEDILKPNSDSDPWEGICYDSENSQLKFSWSMSEKDVTQIAGKINNIIYRLYIFEDKNDTQPGEPDYDDKGGYRWTYNSEISDIFEDGKFYKWYVIAEIETDTQTFRFVSNDYKGLDGTAILRCIGQERCSEDDGPPGCNDQ